uniref:Variant surface glycoprotein 1125.2651 n=1 Tax=Trypanosoma brucei TaxID=5691 RepID=A0A1J0R890_9TRYP|nr:variant surface glycoprotein 1125.2651 [Trypanosoma brucei]
MNSYRITLTFENIRAQEVAEKSKALEALLPVGLYQTRISVLRVACVAAFLAAPVMAGNMASGDNKAVHAALCDFFSMLGRDVNVPEVPAANEADYNFLHELNFSLAPQDWQRKFYEGDERTKVQPSATAAGIVKAGEDRWWPSWAKAATTLKKGAENNAVLAEAKKATSDTARRIAQTTIARLTEQAAEELGLYPARTGLRAELTQDAAREEITAAVLGSSKKTAANVDDTDVFGATIAGKGRAEVCEAKTATPNANSGLAMLACVCMAAATNPVADSACTKDLASAPQGTNGGDIGNTNLQKLLKSCGSKPATKVTAEEIRQALQHMKALIHGGDTDGYIGTKLGTDCSGSSASGMCVKFTALATSGDTVINHLTFISKVTNLASRLTALAEAAAEAS